jgi:hypothetical protein
MSSTQSRALDFVAEAGGQVSRSYQSRFSKTNKPAVTVAEFKLKSCSNMSIGLGPRVHEECPFGSVFGELTSLDISSLDAVITAAYKQVFGNVPPTLNERCTELEARLRQGDINVRGFVAGLAKSEFYKKNFFHQVSPQRGIELNYKHLFGRPPVDQVEMSKSIALLADQGFDALIDHLTGSAEYAEVFGDNTVPYVRAFKSAAGAYTSTFPSMVELQHPSASSDRSLGNRSLIMGRVASLGRIKTSANPNYVYTKAMAPQISPNFFDKYAKASVPVSYNNFSYAKVARA